MLAGLIQIPRHALCMLFPLVCILFLISAPHAPASLVAFAAFPVAVILLDRHAGPAVGRPSELLPAWFFDAILVALAALQLAAVLLLARLASLQGLSVDVLIGAVLVAMTSGSTGIVVSHELVHRRGAWFQLGRVLLASALYEHFATEHVRGHHRRVATPADPATARFGETYGQFFRRTIPGQLASAWELEARRIGRPKRGSLRWLRSRVVQGLLMGWGGAAVIGLVFGPTAVVAHLLQACGAVALLEAVNYIEHWGLVRERGRVRPVHSWDADSWFTFYTLVGLARHADHHTHAIKPWQALEPSPESPQMPFGYWGGAIAAIFQNADLRERMVAELKRREMGPFSPRRAA